MADNSKWFYVRHEVVKDLGYMFWFRETLSEINYVIGSLPDEDINYWDIRVIGMLLLIPVIYLAIPLITFYARHETIKQHKANNSNELALRNKKNIEFMTVFTTLQNGA